MELDWQNAIQNDQDMGEIEEENSDTISDKETGFDDNIAGINTKIIKPKENNSKSGAFNINFIKQSIHF